MSDKKNTKPFYNSIIPDDWKKTELGELVFTISPPIKLSTKDYLESGKYPIVDQGKKIVVGYTNNDNAIFYELPAIIFGDHTKEVKFIDFPFAVGGDGVKILDSSELEKHYLKFIIEKAVQKLPELGYSRHFVELKNIPISYPNKVEQQAIAHMLGLMDAAINKNNLLIEKKALQKKWLMQKLLNGKIRIKEFVKNNQYHRTGLGELPGDWKLASIENILTPVRKAFVPDKNELYQEIGIRSHTKGLFYKEKVNGAILGDKRVFWIEPNCFIVNIVFAWEHAVAKTTEKETGMIASHRFPMFKPNEGVVDLDFLLYYFNSLRGKHLLGLASPGGAGRNKTLGQSEFMKLQIPLPSFNEQTAIAHVLQAADKEIQLLRTKTEKLREEKKGLMQVLLTGKKRLKVK